MSVLEPDIQPGQTTSGLPVFDIVRRGYDRQQVDAFVTDLAVRAEEAGERAGRAERAQAELEKQLATLRGNEPPTFEQLGAEAAMVLEQAGRSAELLLAKARGRAESIVQDAEQASERIRGEAAGAAEAARAAAGEAAERARQQMHEEQSALHTQTEQVRQFRDTVLDDLSRVHADITALLDRTRLGAEAQLPPAPAADGPEPEPDGVKLGRHAKPEPAEA